MLYCNIADPISLLQVAAGNRQSEPGRPCAIHHGNPQIVGPGGNVGRYGEFGCYLITFPFYPRRLVEVFIYREINLRTQVYGLLVETCVLFGSLLAILLVALGLTNLMIDAQLPMILLNSIEEHVSSPLQFLLLLNFFLLLVGAMMDIFSAIIVVVPLILPIATRYGIDPVHLGIIFLANLEIGYSTPPVGINLFIASQRFGKDIITLFKSTLPYLLIMFIWLLMITYIPELSLWWKTDK